MLDLRLDCQACDAELKRERGCEGQSVVAWHLDGKVLRRCPLTLVTDTSWALLTAYSLYKQGILPSGQGWLKETQKYVSAMIHIENQVAKAEAEQAKKVNNGRHKT